MSISPQKVILFCDRMAEEIIASKNSIHRLEVEIARLRHSVENVLKSEAAK